MTYVQWLSGARAHGGGGSAPLPGADRAHGPAEGARGQQQPQGAAAQPRPHPQERAAHAPRGQHRRRLQGAGGTLFIF